MEPDLRGQRRAPVCPAPTRGCRPWPTWEPVNLPGLLGAGQPVPAEHRSNFRHLYLDIAWFGVLAASSMAFMTVYAARQGAAAFQVGLMSAGPASMNILLALPAGRWLRGRPVDRSVFWSAAFHRFFYLAFVPLPWLLGAADQVWALVGLTLLMSVPGTLLAVGFNAMFAETVPPAYRGQVVGVRNGLLAITYILVSLLCGYLLERLPFPQGYQVVFGLGFLGAAMSTLHLWFIRPPTAAPPRARVGRALGDLAWPGRIRPIVEGLRPGVALRFLVRRRGAALRPGVLRGRFGRFVAILFAFHVALHLAIPLFPLHWVHQLHLSDRDIGLGSALFYVSVLLASTQLVRLVRRYGNQRVTALGAVFMASYPFFMALSRGLDLFLVGSIGGGLGWALVAGALVNYVLEIVPDDNRPPYLAWYNLALNAALLSGSLVGPLLAGLIGRQTVLYLSALLRFLTALLILRAR
jgi:predicted MFS family arabinose efflux permease